MTIPDAILFQSVSVIFAAGALWSKLNSISSKLDEHIKKHEDHHERLAKIETELKNLKKAEA